MKKLFLGLGISLLISLISLVVIVPRIAGPKIKEMIETKGSEALGQPVRVDDVKVGFIPPLSVEILGLHTQIKKPGGLLVEVNAPSTHVHLPLVAVLSHEINLNIILSDLKLEVSLPVVVAGERPKAAEPVTVARFSTPASPYKIDLKLELKDATQEP
jgi:hypothetical protein